MCGGGGGGWKGGLLEDLYCVEVGLISCVKDGCTYYLGLFFYIVREGFTVYIQSITWIKIRSRKRREKLLHDLFLRKRMTDTMNSQQRYFRNITVIKTN